MIILGTVWRVNLNSYWITQFLGKKLSTFSWSCCQAFLSIQTLIIVRVNDDSVGVILRLYVWLKVNLLCYVVFWYLCFCVFHFISNKVWVHSKINVELSGYFSCLSENKLEKWDDVFSMELLSWTYTNKSASRVQIKG